jgi:hypothetical protein
MKGRETGPSALETNFEKKGRIGFRVTNENIDAKAFGYGLFSIFAQAQTGTEFFALVESNRGS